MATIFRTPETGRRYRKHRAEGALEAACPLCERTPLSVFTYWKIITNHFPYDRVARVHHMIVPLRHATEASLTPEETAEYYHIKNEELQTYDYILETTNTIKSIPAHFHQHLIVCKEELD